jgi:LysR family glycine cleavage system transcriptional activator
LSLTDAGTRLFPAIRGGLEAFAAAIAAVKRSDQQPLRVTATNALASRWLVPRLPEWRKLHPDAPLEVIGTDRVLDLQAGDADVAIRYATRRIASPGGLAEEFLSDTFWPLCNPRLLLARRLKRTADLTKHTLIHSYWSPTDSEPPTWPRWLAAAQSKWRDVPELKDMQHLSFWEELHAIEAVIVGQGIGIFSDALVAKELACGALVKAFNLSLPGYRFYIVRRRDHPCEKAIRAFSALRAFLARSAVTCGRRFGKSFVTSADLDGFERVEERSRGAQHSELWPAEKRQRHQPWLDRVRGQLLVADRLLEAEIGLPWLFGAPPLQVDVNAAAPWRFRCAGDRARGRSSSRPPGRRSKVSGNAFHERFGLRQ